jgi:hypothetical protein
MRKNLTGKFRCSDETKLRKTTASNQLQKGGENQFMRILAIITLAFAAIGMSACAHKDNTMSTTTTAKTGYSK